MKLHYLQHVPFEGPARIESWSTANGHSLSGTRLHNDEPVPNLNDIDWLFVMGGPMNVYQEHKYPWLNAEKKLIELAIADGKAVIGVCLGAQLIADVLGARVFPNREKEIGWFPIELTEAARNSSFFGSWPPKLHVFQWHGDTFELPVNSVHLAYSEACQNQAFLYGDRVIGLQFHLESTREGVSDLLENCKDEIVDASYVQLPQEILGTESDYDQVNKAMSGMLDQLAVALLSRIAA